MTWTAELVHLFRRDLRRTLWPLLGYVGAVLIAIAIGTETLGAGGRMIASIGQSVILIAPVLVAMTVLADSTMRVDAFWAVQPVRTSAVIASKLLNCSCCWPYARWRSWSCWPAGNWSPCRPMPCLRPHSRPSPSCSSARR